MSDPKPSIKSLEGQGLIGILGTGVVFIYLLIKSMNPELPDIDALLDKATSAAEIAEVYGVMNSETVDMVKSGNIGAILLTMYKVYTRFLDKRTELKK